MSIFTCVTSFSVLWMWVVEFIQYTYVYIGVYLFNVEDWMRRSINLVLTLHYIYVGIYYIYVLQVITNKQYHSFYIYISSKYM